MPRPRSRFPRTQVFLQERRHLRAQLGGEVRIAAVLAVGDELKRHLEPGFLISLLHALRLIEIDRGVLVAMDDEQRRITLANLKDRAGKASTFRILSGS